MFAGCCWIGSRQSAATVARLRKSALYDRERPAPPAGFFMRCGIIGSMRFRELRIAISTTCLIACVLLVALWVRSYFKVDYVHGETAQRMICMSSYHGRFGLLWMNSTYTTPPESRTWDFNTLPASEGRWRVYNDWTGSPLPSYLRFESSSLSARLSGKFLTSCPIGSPHSRAFWVLYCHGCISYAGISASARS